MVKSTKRPRYLTLGAIVCGLFIFIGVGAIWATADNGAEAGVKDTVKADFKPTWRKYQDKDLNFSLHFPKGSLYRLAGDEISPVNDTDKLKATVFDVPLGTAQGEQRALAFYAIDQSFSNVYAALTKKFGTLANTVLDGHQGVSFTLINSDRAVQYQVVTLGGAQTFIVVCYETGDDNLDNLISETLKSFAFDK